MVGRIRPYFSPQDLAKDKQITIAMTTLEGLYQSAGAHVDLGAVGHKNDFSDPQAIAEAVQRPTMHFVAIKTSEQSDFLSLHRVRSPSFVELALQLSVS
jgi:hypothetical protein